MPRRTRAQRKWIRKGYPYEMIPLHAEADGKRYSYLLHTNGRAWRTLAGLMGMVVRPTCTPMIHNGRKPR